MVAVNLTKSVQYGLSTALSAKEQLDVATNRLASGKEVRSALDDPSAYFTSQSLSAGAATLDRILTKLTQGVQTVKAADTGLTSIAKQIDVAKSLTTRAQATDDLFERAGYADQMNTLFGKITELAKDAGYGDRNLLAGAGNDLKLYFSDDSSYAAEIRAVADTDLATFGLAKIAAGTRSSVKIDLDDGTNPLKTDSLLVADSDTFAIGDKIEVQKGGNVIASYTVTSSSTVADLVSHLTAADQGFRANFANGELTFEALGDATVTGGKAGGGLASITFEGEEPAWAAASAIDAAIDSLSGARKIVESQTATFASDLTMLQNRLTFMTDYSSVMKLTSESAVAADPNEEGANVLALKLRQELATTSLSLSRTVDESVLRMLV